jgi:hypothetical protein
MKPVPPDWDGCKLHWESMVENLLEDTHPVRKGYPVHRTGPATAPEQIEMAVRQALEQGLVTPPRSLLQQGTQRSGRVIALVRRAIEGAKVA